MPPQAETDHLGNQHGDGLAQHRGFRLDAADTPTEDADAVDHGGVRISAHQRIRVGHQLTILLDAKHHARQVLQVDLVHDPGVGWHHPEITEGVLAPAQETVTLLVTLELDDVVEIQRIVRSEPVDLDRVIDHQFGG